MQKKRHLTLVYSNNYRQESNNKTSKWQSLFEDLRFLFISQNKKIETLRAVILNMYRDYEITSGQSDVPYFIRTENKINKIIQEGKINYYYKKLRKFQDYMNSI